MRYSSELATWVIRSVSLPGCTTFHVNTDEISPVTWNADFALPRGLRLRVAELRGPLRGAAEWRPLIHGQIYTIGGYEDRRRVWAGYAGISAAVSPGRAWDSYSAWTHNEPAFTPRRVALITGGESLLDDELHLMESRVIRHLSGIGIYQFNTQVSAKEASHRLGARANDVAALGDHVATEIAAQVFRGNTNPLSTPAHTLRESAVRAVLSADRALDSWEVLRRLRAMGVLYGGSTPDRTVRRDLSVRELDTAGTPRVLSGYQDGRALFWSHALPTEVALARYAAVRARRRRHTTPSPVAA
jgi:hypothetical protein